ncbi:MAG TPA: DUF6338 family protein [Steroidobacteraceae bacterium]|nr:DUF6338 family protein [Steroidobacteraceae bacterium]
MDDFGQKLIVLLQYLLPGFFAAWVYYGLTSFAKPSQFERVVQALIFTLLVQALAFIMKLLLLSTGKWWPVFAWTDKSDLALSIVSGFVLGTVFAAFANNDRFHALMRWLRVTSEMSYPSEWYGVFRDNESYVVLHLKSFSRIYGWPSLWPSEPGKGHFLLEEASWLDDENHETPMTNVAQVLVPASEVQLVEFVNLHRRSRRGDEVAKAGTTSGTDQ